MKTFFTFIIISFLMVCCSNPETIMEQVDTLAASSLNVYGRYLLSDNQEIEMIGSATHFGFGFKGRECKLFANIKYPGGHNYLQYELDGVYQKKVRISGTDSLPITISALNDSIHQVWIYKTTEASTGPLFIDKITGISVQALSKPDAPFIEFIGNSITCGAAADSTEIPCGQGEYHDHHDAYHAYGPMLARKLNVNYMLSSVSGIGIYRNWNSEGPTLPQVYETADLHESSTRRWDFSKYSPTIVSIALGTNDFSNGDGSYQRKPFDKQIFTEKYIRFVQLIKSKYPAAKIILLSSPMVGGERGETLKSCLNSVKEVIDILYPNDEPVTLYFFKPMHPQGCDWHPSVEQHGMLAEELALIFKQLLGK